VTGRIGSPLPMFSVSLTTSRGFDHGILTLPRVLWCPTFLRWRRARGLLHRCTFEGYKMTKATKFIREAAARCRASGVTVDIDSPYSTVAIDAPGEDGIFMQGDEAETFISEVRALCKRYPSLDEDTAALALAEPYAETLFN
jgi:hypothetical protein